ncbi:MAG: hypothetical protein AB7G93_15905 [Bdellovibrionales bacterium]
MGKCKLIHLEMVCVGLIVLCGCGGFEPADVQDLTLRLGTSCGENSESGSCSPVEPEIETPGPVVGDPQPQPQPANPMPPIVGSLDPYIPNIPASQCQPSQPVINPMANAKFNKRTVCSDGCDYKTIVEAVNSAQPYDEIVISPGIYKGCLNIKASPIIVRGDGGLAQIDSTNCGTTTMGTVVTVRSEFARLSNIKVTKTTSIGFTFLPTSKFAELSDFWVEDAPIAVSASVGQGTLVLSRFKIRDVGYVWGASNHEAAVISVAGQKAIVSLGTFSDFRLNSWGVAAHAPEVEYLCNVSLRVNDEAGHAFHMNNNARVRIARSYFHQHKRDNVFYYQYQSPGTELLWEDNVLMSEVSPTLFQGTQPKSVNVIFRRNTFIGDGLKSLTDAKIDITSENKFFGSRSDAGIPAYPAIPSNWPIDPDLL